jgi:hypothetical protein
MKLKTYIKTNYLSVPKHVIESAVCRFDRDYISALALIRGSCRNKDGAFATLKQAQEIYMSITGKAPWERKIHD